MNILELFPAFLWRAWCGGLCLASLAGPLGACLLWKRMAYFGDALAHASLLGVTLGVVMSWSTSACIFLIALLFSIVLLNIESKTRLSTDTLLGIFSHSSLALGLIAVSLLPHYRSTILSLLFGDVLTLSWTDIRLIASVCLLVLVILLKIWRPLLTLMIDPELAQVEGIPVQRIHALYLCLLASFIAVAIKLVGVLLMTALLVIPAATSRLWSKAPLEMCYKASLLGIFAVTGGLLLSLYWDTPTGPSIVIVATSAFFASFLYKKLLSKK